MIADRPTATEDEITRQLIEEMAVKGAAAAADLRWEHGRKAPLDPDQPEVLPRPRPDQQAIAFRRACTEHAGSAPVTRAGIAARKR